MEGSLLLGRGRTERGKGYDLTEWLWKGKNTDGKNYKLGKAVTIVLFIGKAE